MLDLINKFRVLLAPREKWQLIGIVLMMTIAALWEVAGIGLVLPVVAAVVNPELLEQNIYLKAFYDLSPVKEPREFMIFTAVLVVANFVVKNCFSWWVIRLQSTFIFRKYLQFSERMYSNFLFSPYSFHLEHSAAELNSRLARTQWACDSALLPLMALASDALVVLALLAALICFMPGTVGVAMAVLLLAGGIFYWPFRSCNRKLGQDVIKYDAAMTQSRLDGLNGIKDAKSCNCENFLLNKFKQDVADFCRVQNFIYQLGQIPRLGLETLAVLLAMGIFAAMVLQGVPAGSIVLSFALLVTAMGRLLPALSRMHYNITRIRQISAVFEELYDNLVNIQSETAVVPGEKISYSLQKELSINKLSFQYPGSSKPVLSEFSLQIPAKSSVALTGPTGGGKTTLADLIVGLLQPQAGEIVLDGVDIRRDIYSYRNLVAYVPQFIYLSNASVMENVAFGVAPEDIDEDKVRQVLAMAQLDKLIDSWPDKLDTYIGENGIKLSGGQRQRLGIARALYRDPELLILDEATSALDNETENAIVQALETLHGKLTTIVIAHRLTTVEHCDMQIVIGREQ